MKVARQIIDKNGKQTTVHVNPAKNVKQNTFQRLFGIEPQVKKPTNLTMRQASNITATVHAMKSGFFADEESAAQFFLDLQNEDAFGVYESYRERSLRVESVDGATAIYIYTKNGKVWDATMTDLTQFTGRENPEVPTQNYMDDQLALRKVVSYMRNY